MWTQRDTIHIESGGTRRNNRRQNLQMFFKVWKEDTGRNILHYLQFIPEAQLPQIEEGKYHSEELYIKNFLENHYYCPKNNSQVQTPNFVIQRVTVIFQIRTLIISKFQKWTSTIENVFTNGHIKDWHRVDFFLILFGLVLRKSHTLWSNSHRLQL